MSKEENGCLGCLAIGLLSILYVIVIFVVAFLSYWMICLGLGLEFNIWVPIGVVGGFTLMRLILSK